MNIKNLLLTSPGLEIHRSRLLSVALPYNILCTPCMHVSVSMHVRFSGFFLLSSIRDRSLLIVGVGPKRKWLGQEKCLVTMVGLRKKLNSQGGWVKKK